MKGSVVSRTGNITKSITAQAIIYNETIIPYARQVEFKSDRPYSSFSRPYIRQIHFALALAVL